MRTKNLDKMLVLRANATHVDTRYWQAGKTSGEWEYFINSTLGSMIQLCLSLIISLFFFFRLQSDARSVAEI